MNTFKNLVERKNKLNEMLLRHNDRLEGVDLQGKKVRFQTKDSGGKIFIYPFGEDKPVAQLGAGEKDVAHAEIDLVDAKLVKKGTLKIMED